MNKEIEQPIETSTLRCKNCGAPLYEVGTTVQHDSNESDSVICNNCGYIQLITQNV